jgi:HEAT repeat protein
VADGRDSATLIQLTKDTVGDVRLAALRAIHDRSSGQGVRGAVIPLLQDADARVQALAAYHLRQNLAGDINTFRQQLLNMLGSGNFKVRYEAALALLAYNDKGGANTMLADLATAKASQRLQAADAYQRITSAR